MAQRLQPQPIRSRTVHPLVPHEGDSAAESTVDGQSATQAPHESSPEQLGRLDVKPQKRHDSKTSSSSPGDAAGAEGKGRLSTRVSDDIRWRAKSLAARQRVSMEALIEAALREYIDRHEGMA